jgi:aminoglycoside phosphotransferase (APT) family kinase protein
MGDILEPIPDAFRARAAEAIGLVADPASVVTVEQMTAGASGALAYRVDTTDRSYVLRMETSRDLFRNPERTYPCMVAAARAGLAPAVHHADATAGVVVMDHVDVRPLDEHPGGPAGVAREVAAMVRRLHEETEPFPPMLGDLGELLAGMLGFVAGSDLFAPGALQPHLDGFEEIRTAYPWDRWPQVSAHNDLNPFNLLFDGERIWFVDWELAFRNDRFADLAGLANGLELPEAAIVPMLEAGLGGAPADRLALARFDVHCQLNRLFYACLLTSGAVGAIHGADAHGRTPDEFRRDVARGVLRAGTVDVLFALATSQLRVFVEGLDAPHLRESLRIVAND